MSEKLANIEEKKINPDISKLNTEIIKWLTFEQRLDTRERLRVNLDRSKELLDNMMNILNTFDSEKKWTMNITATQMVSFQNNIISRFEYTSMMFEKVLSEIKSTKVWLSESEVKLILNYEDSYYKYNNIITDRIALDYSKSMTHRF